MNNNEMVELLKSLQCVDNRCPVCECSWYANEVHKPDCKIGTTIKALQSYRLVVVDIGKRYTVEIDMSGSLLKMERIKE